MTIFSNARLKMLIEVAFLKNKQSSEKVQKYLGIFEIKSPFQLYGNSKFYNISKDVKMDCITADGVHNIKNVAKNDKDFFPEI